MADQPWSGSYAIGKNTWAMAHTTQFTAARLAVPRRASGYLGGNRANGSYVTLKSPNNSDYSTIIETIDADRRPDRSNFTVTGGLSTGTVHVWATDLELGQPGRPLRHARPTSRRPAAASA